MLLYLYSQRCSAQYASTIVSNILVYVFGKQLTSLLVHFFFNKSVLQSAFTKHFGLIDCNMPSNVFYSIFSYPFFVILSKILVNSCNSLNSSHRTAMPYHLVKPNLWPLGTATYGTAKTRERCSDLSLRRTGDDLHVSFHKSFKTWLAASYHFGVHW